jgi:hypothetical protein
MFYKYSGVINNIFDPANLELIFANSLLDFCLHKNVILLMNTGGDYTILESLELDIKRNILMLILIFRKLKRIKVHDEGTLKREYCILTSDINTNNSNTHIASLGHRLFGTDDDYKFIIIDIEEEEIMSIREKSFVKEWFKSILLRVLITFDYLYLREL